MEQEEFLARMATGERVVCGSETHLEMCALSREAQKITAELNAGYHTEEETVRLMSRLTGREVDGLHLRSRYSRISAGTHFS